MSKYTRINLKRFYNLRRLLSVIRQGVTKTPKIQFINMTILMLICFECVLYFCLTRGGGGGGTADKNRLKNQSLAILLINSID